MAENPDYPYFQHDHPHPPTQSRQFNALVRNIVTTHDELTKDYPHVLRANYEWYDKAHDIANKLGGGNIIKGAGVLAAMSPQKKWDLNQKLAQDMFKTGTAGQTGVQVAKARRIIDGEHPADVLGDLKEGHFFHNIFDPSDTSHVTIDRHAHDIARREKWGNNPRGLGAVGRYNTFVDAYGAASQHLGIQVPSRLQAGVWAGQEAGLTRFS